MSEALSLIELNQRLPSKWGGGGLFIVLSHEGVSEGRRGTWASAQVMRDVLITHTPTQTNKELTTNAIKGCQSLHGHLRK